MSTNIISLPTSVGSVLTFSSRALDERRVYMELVFSQGQTLVLKHVRKYISLVLYNIQDDLDFPLQQYILSYKLFETREEKNVLLIGGRELN